MKFLKLTGLLLTTIMSASLMVGCAQVSADKMITPPKASVKADNIQKKIEEKFGKDISLITPPSTQDLSPINFRDLDGDSKQEAIVFFRNPKDNRLKGVILKDINGKLEIYEGIDGVGKEIEKVSFDDIDNNKKEEIYISWQPESSYDIGFGVYEFYGSKIDTIKEDKVRTWFLGDLDDDQINELYVFNEERENMDNPNTRLERYELKDGKLNIVDTCRIEDFAFGPQSVMFGNAKLNQKGIFMDIATGNAGFTDLIVLKDGKMHNVFYDQKGGFTDKTFKPGPTPSYDVDKDGIVEISIPTQSKGYENEAMAFVVWITEWFKWDGKDGLVHVMDTYENYPMNMSFVMEKGWKEKLKIEVNNYDSDQTFVKFFYEDESNKELLFEIQYVAPKNAKEFEDRGYQKLKIDNKNIYYVKINNELESQNAKEFQLNIDQINERMSNLITNPIF